MKPGPGGLVGALGLITLGLVLLGSALVVGSVEGEGTSRSAGSTWYEGPTGASRLHALLVEAGRDVRRHEDEIASLPTEGVLVVLAPPGGLRFEEEAALLDRVERGADLVLASENVPPALAGLGLQTQRHPLTGVAQPQVPSSQAQAGPGLVSTGDTLLDPVPGLAPLYATDEGVLLGGLVVGEGKVYLLTDPSQLSNTGLDDPVNVRLAGALFPAGDVPITFVEGVHGYTAARGLVPWLWRAGWGPMLLAALLSAGVAGWRAAARPGGVALTTEQGAGGLALLAGAVGRMRLSQGLHARSLGQLLGEARQRRIPENHPAVTAGHQALRDPDLTPEAALAAAVALEQMWR